MEITQEQLQNMSPEEIADLQKQQCVFCHIVEGKVASKKVYEDNDCIAILDINPANPGHMLLLTKEHYQIMPQVPEDVIGHMFVVAKHLSQAALKALQVKGTNVVIANGIAAGQKAPHFMIHIIPRTEGDGLKFIVPQKRTTENDLKTLIKSIKPRINKQFGIEDDEPVDVVKKPEKIKEKVVEAEFEDEKGEEEELDQEEEKEEKELETEEGKQEEEIVDEPMSEGDVEEPEPEDVEKDQKNIDLDKIAELFGK